MSLIVNNEVERFIKKYDEWREKNRLVRMSILIPQRRTQSVGNEEKSRFRNEANRLLTEQGGLPWRNRTEEQRRKLNDIQNDLIKILMVSGRIIAVV